jgi:hypothetical protein
MTLDMAEVEARVAKGLHWLKTVGAEHGLNYMRIDVFDLNMSSGDSCAFSMACGRDTTYGDKRYELILKGVLRPSAFRNWDREHGFWATSENAEPFDDAEEYAMLALAWVRALRADPGWCQHRGLSQRPFISLAKAS